MNGTQFSEGPVNSDFTGVLQVIITVVPSVIQNVFFSLYILIMLKMTSRVQLQKQDWVEIRMMPFAQLIIVQVLRRYV